MIVKKKRIVVTDVKLSNCGWIQEEKKKSEQEIPALN
jgi:hypothetical protein